MNIYYLERTAREPWEYDFRGFVIIAGTPEEALKIASDRCFSGTTFSCREIGTSPHTVSGIVLSDHDEET